MRPNSVKHIMKRTGAFRLPLLGVMFCLAMGFVSCESIYDDQSGCRTGIALNFVYEYHMERGANAFPTNVDCVDVLVFDTNGNFVKHFVETSDILRDPAYAMEIPLDKGDYHLVVWGGMACDDTAFELTPEFPEAEAVEALGSRAGTPRQEDIRVVRPLTDGISSEQLHDIDARTGGLFYGTLDVSVTERAYEFKHYTVELMKDTNNIQIVLQELSTPDQCDVNDYDFKIVDDNFVLDGFNNPVPIADGDFQPIYKPYQTYNRTAGYVETGREGEQVEEDEKRPVQVACAEFSTSRLFVQHMSTARLVVSSVDKDGSGSKEIINIPLLTYLSMIRGFGDSWIKSDQEFLDRQSRWTLMFFLQHNAWISTKIVVNWWTVRVNDIDLGM